MQCDSLQGLEWKEWSGANSRKLQPLLWVTLLFCCLRCGCFARHEHFGHCSKRMCCVCRWRCKYSESEDTGVYLCLFELLLHAVAPRGSEFYQGPLLLCAACVRAFLASPCATRKQYHPNGWCLIFIYKAGMEKLNVFPLEMWYPRDWKPSLIFWLLILKCMRWSYWGKY